jgi:hypothetical protein
MCLKFVWSLKSIDTYPKLRPDPKHVGFASSEGLLWSVCVQSDCATGTRTTQRLITDSFLQQSHRSSPLVATTHFPNSSPIPLGWPVLLYKVLSRHYHALKVDPILVCTVCSSIRSSTCRHHDSDNVRVCTAQYCAPQQR